MSRSILLIDDDVFLPTILEIGLAPHAFELRHACDGGRGVAMAKSDPPNLILLDFAMPGMDGLETLECLQAHIPLAQVKIVAISGLALANPRCREMIARSDAYLPKPFDLKRLRRAIAEVLSADFRR